MRCGFRTRDHDRMTEMMERVLVGFGQIGRVLGCNAHEAISVPRLTAGASNEVQMVRNLTGGLPEIGRAHV